MESYWGGLYCGSAFSYLFGAKKGTPYLVMFSISGAEAPDACFEACLKMFCSNDEALVSLEVCFQVCLKGIFLRQQEAVLLQHKFSVETASCVALNCQTWILWRKHKVGVALSKKLKHPCLHWYLLDELAALWKAVFNFMSTFLDCFQIRVEKKA